MATPGRKRRSRAKAQPQRRRWVMPVLLCTAMLTISGGLFAAYNVLSQPGRLPLRVIEIQGEFRQLEHPAIEHAVMATIDGGFFSCDMPKLREAVLQMPWVAEVSIRRSWPDKLSMTVTEQVPLARWGEDALINVAGGVFRPDSIEAFSRLVKLSGPQGSERRVVAFYQQLIPAARSRELQLQAIELDERRHWWLHFADGLTVSLGDEDIANRLAQFFRVYPSLVAQPARRPLRVDMRYAHGFAVRWRELPVDDATVSQEKV